MSFEFLFGPVEHLDEQLAHLFDGAPLLLATAVALLLGLRHASDPDHLVAVTSLVASEGGDARGAARLGAWWGLGHAAMLLAAGIPLIAFEAELPAWLEGGAERAVGVVILLLGARVLWRWAIASRHRAAARSPAQAFGIGVLHGLAGTGAVVLLLIAALPTQLGAALALLVFAPMSAVSMAGCSAAFAWGLTRGPVEPVCSRLLVPALGAFGIAFGLWYAGIA